jgi:uncharacterized protein (DUF1501 family)
MNTRFDRRRFLTAGSALAGVFAVGSRSLLAQAKQAHRTLVLVELTGGNDGLSTVVPFADDVYHRSRPNLRLSANEVLKLDAERGLHPSLDGLRNLYDKGTLAIVEGAGYPNPVRSHFRSLEIWHGGDLRGRAVGTGWIGRLCDSAWRDDHTAELVVHVGPKVPFSLASFEHPPIALESPTAYQWFGAEPEVEAYRGAAKEEAEYAASAGAAAGRDSGRDEALARLRGIQASANESSVHIRRAIKDYRPAIDYPRDRFSASLRDIAALIHGDLGSRVLSTNLATFDTHADQKDTQANLLRKLDDGLCAFLSDLTRSELGRETIVVVYSEFGRRVAENASRGTDHGKAGPMFVLGARVRGGFHGKAPNLRDLDDGDAAFTTDFRSVYATVLERWFEASSATVLGEAFEQLDFV